MRSALMPPSLRARLGPIIGEIRTAHPVGGGDVSRAARVEGTEATVFAKWRDGGAMFEDEAEGLRALTEAAGPNVVVPQPLLAANATETRPGLLVLPWLDRGRPSRTDWHRFGAALAALHRTQTSGEGYGWPHDNWIGSKPQRNGWSEAWPAFFGQRRLQAQADTVRAHGAWRAEWDALLDRLVSRLGEILPETPPRSLLHGDLWAGNALPLSDGRFALLDPAVSVGHREADLAMTELFGGFDAAFYEGYREVWPLEPGYPERRTIYNLFHLTNHLTHGPGYAASVERVLRAFG
ncbi:MAG: fructosamine kinase family protein [Bacteroidota bacterium]